MVPSSRMSLQTPPHAPGMTQARMAVLDKPETLSAEQLERLAQIKRGREAMENRERLGKAKSGYVEPVTGAQADGKQHALAEHRDERTSKTHDPFSKHSQPFRKRALTDVRIRAFSRGVIGCAFFAIGQRKVQADLVGYDPNGPAVNALQHVAKFIDIAVGKPLAWAINDDFVRFRPTVSYQHDASGNPIMGEGIGPYATRITFDFFCASIGDALGRDIVGLFDPTVKTEWIKNGVIDLPEAAKSLVKTTWRYVTYNGGEDWAVSVPYALALRAGRNFLDKHFPGFGYDSDRSLNGGSFKVNDEGKIVGNYQLPGAIDLQYRFTVYNIFTLIYREMYHKIGEAFKDWRYSGYELPQMNWSARTPTEWVTHGLDKAAHGAVDGARYLLKSAIKGTIYMTPAVPFFWFFRTPQSKYKGLAIHPEKGPVAFHDAYTKDPNGAFTFDINVNGVDTDVRYNAKPLVNGNQRLWENSYASSDYADYDHKAMGFDLRHLTQTPGGIKAFLGGQEIEDPFAAKSRRDRFNPFNSKQFINGQWQPTQDQHFMTKVTDALGGFNYRAGDLTNRLLQPIGKEMQIKPDVISSFSRRYMDAVTSYTPYMWMKAVTAHAWDTPGMDKGLNHLIDGAFTLNGKEFRKGVMETWLAFRHPTRSPANPSAVPTGQEMAGVPQGLNRASIEAPRQFSERVQSSRTIMQETVPMAPINAANSIIQARENGGHAKPASAKELKNMPFMARVMNDSKKDEVGSAVPVASR